MCKWQIYFLEEWSCQTCLKSTIVFLAYICNNFSWKQECDTRIKWTGKTCWYYWYRGILPKFIPFPVFLFCLYIFANLFYFQSMSDLHLPCLKCLANCLEDIDSLKVCSCFYNKWMYVLLDYKWCKRNLKG